jgi:hypothetical protein
MRWPWGGASTDSRRLVWFKGSTPIGNGKEQYLDVGIATSPEQNQSARIVIENGATLRSTSRILLVGGELVSRMNPDDTGNYTATIKGDLYNYGADVRICLPAPDLAAFYGVLKVDGSVEWSGGTYRPSVNGTSGKSDADLWLSTGAFTIKAGAKIGNRSRGQTLEIQGGFWLGGRKRVDFGPDFSIRHAKTP